MSGFRSARGPVGILRGEGWLECSAALGRLAAVELYVEDRDAKIGDRLKAI